MKPIAVLPAVALFLSAIPAQAQVQAPSFADPAAIDAAVARFTGAAVGQAGGAAQPVDRRLRLARCLQPLAVAWHGPADAPHRDTVVVRCPDAGGWRLFVPVQPGGGGAAAAVAVTRGDALTVVAGGEGFSVSQPGEALESGPVGAWIKVRPGGKVEALRAQVVRPGLVRVPVP